VKPTQAFRRYARAKAKGKRKDVESVFGGASVNITSMGFMIFDPVWGRNDHTTHANELIHVIRGNLSLRIAKRCFKAGPGDTLVVPARTIHRDGFDPDEGLEVFIVFFKWKPAEEFFSLVDNRLLLSMSAELKREIARTFNRLRADRAAEAGTDRLVAQSRVATILMLMLREALGRKGPRGRSRRELDNRRRRRSRLIREAKDYLHEHMHECVSLERIARALHVSPFHLSHVFSEENEFSLFAYLTTLRMERAKTLLTEGRMNVSQVAFSVGFASANYFSKVFRRHFGRSPSEYVGGPPPARKRN